MACLHETQNLCRPTEFCVVRQKLKHFTLCHLPQIWSDDKKIVSYDRKFVFLVNTPLL
jgi:hypothetical protein